MVSPVMSRPPRRRLLALVPFALLAACATPSVPLQVNVASVDRIEGASMELRFVARLRVQNSNDMSIPFSGASVQLLLNGKTIGSGVNDVAGTVPRFGEAMVNVPVTVSGLGDVRQAIGLYGAPNRRLDVTLNGRLNGPGFDALPFQWRGEMAMPLPAGS
jgi:LEA14-like dessication related protein